MFIRVILQNIIERILMDKILLKCNMGAQAKKVSRTTPNIANVTIPDFLLDLPKQYKGPQTVDRDIKTNGANAMVYTTIPEQFSSAPEHPDGHTQCMLMGTTEAQIVRSPLYLTQPIPKVAVGTVIIKTASEGAGLGMFAGRDIKFGEFIVAERPLLMHPADFLYNPGAAGVHYYTYEQHMAIMRHEIEIGLEVALGRMSDQNQAAYKSLFNSHTEDGPLLGIMRTNAFGVNIDELTRTTSAANLPKVYSIVTKDGSRINHRYIFISENIDFITALTRSPPKKKSCVPNVCQKFSITSFSNQIIAIRDIKAGEEILYPYCDLLLPVAGLREALAPYGFTCSCRTCSTASPESDGFRQTCHENVARYQRIYDLALELGEGTDDIKKMVLRPAAELRGRMQEEGLGGMSEQFVGVTILLHKAYTKVGMEEEAKELHAFLKTWVLFDGA